MNFDVSLIFAASFLKAISISFNLKLNSPWARATSPHNTSKVGDKETNEHNLNWIYSVSINKVTSKTLMDKCNTVYPCLFHTLCGECIFLMRQQWLYDSAIFNRSLPKLLNRLEYYWLRSYFYIHTVGEGVRWWYAIFGAKSQRPTCWTFYSWISNCFLNRHSCTNLLSLSRLFIM